MKKIVYFDMDGTIADLYGVENVFKRLDALDASVYLEAEPIQEYIQMIRDFHHMGYEVNILSCLGMISEEVFDKNTKENKDKWLDKYVGCEYINKRIYIPNTKHKEEYIDAIGILVDDDERVLVNWPYDRIRAIPKNKAIK